MENVDVASIYDLFTHDGLRTYKYKNSEMKPAGTVEHGKKGAIFGFRSKKHMIDGRGVVLTSKEAILDNHDKFSHWTPNVYRYGTYTSDNRLFTVGHSEKNLRQINTFYIDFDINHSSQSMSSNDILLASLDLGFVPAVILQTDKGYQAYFVLDTPVFVTAKSNFKVIDVAKEISQNLRKYFATRFAAVDLECNHFGIARMPREDNIVFYEPQYVYSFKELMNWSLKQSEMTRNTPSLTLLAGSKGKRQVDEPWFDLLLHKSHFSGKKGLMGRNNVMFTLSLAYFASGYTQETCEYNILEFNDRLVSPVEEKEALKIVKSAYSGNYQAASREYVKTLCSAWVSEDLTSEDLFVKQGWVKFKKERSQRQRSHLTEWAEDLMVYLIEKSDKTKPYLTTTKKEIREAIGIPARSLDKLLKQLKAKNDVFYRVKAGRSGGIRIAAVKTLIANILSTKKAERAAYYEELSRAFGVEGSFIQTVLQQGLATQETAHQVDLFELDTG